MPDTLLKRYRLLDRTNIHGRFYPAGAVVELLPSEVSDRMVVVTDSEYLASELAGAVCAGIRTEEAGFVSLNGHRAQRGTVALDIPRRLLLSTRADESGVNLMIFGANGAGEPIHEILRGPISTPDTPEVISANEYLTVTGLASSGAISGLTIDALETKDEVAARVKETTDRQRALFLNEGRTPEEEAEVERLMARKAELDTMPKRSPRQEDELKQLNVVLAPRPKPTPSATDTPAKPTR